MKPTHGISAFALHICGQWEEGTRPTQGLFEPDVEFCKRYDKWRARHLESARLIYYMTHRETSFDAKVKFLAECGLV